ncbi:hypothetical protein LIA77_07227 [Sarocladium implicatum]|nr:hypothetical protein LIA77_07227 [Sarocladium implicatum]
MSTINTPSLAGFLHPTSASRLPDQVHISTSHLGMNPHAVHPRLTLQMLKDRLVQNVLVSRLDRSRAVKSIETTRHNPLRLAPRTRAWATSSNFTRAKFRQRQRPGRWAMNLQSRNRSGGHGPGGIQLQFSASPDPVPSLLTLQYRNRGFASWSPISHEQFPRWQANQVHRHMSMSASLRLREAHCSPTYLF